MASSSTATARMTPISLGAIGPESANVMKTTTITAAAALITRPVPASPSTSAWRGVARAVVDRLDRREQEHRVVHRQREDEREEEDRRPRVDEALRLEAEQLLERSVLEHQPRDAERRRGREQVERDGGGRGERRPQQHEQQQEAEAEDHADDDRQARHERALEVAGLGGGAAEQRAGRELARGRGRSSPAARRCRSPLRGSR